jgi:hypothetical protein
MRVPAFDRLVENFTQKSDSLKDQISEMLYLIANGKVPSKQDVCKFENAVDALQVDYDSIRARTEESVLAGELPANGSSVSEYINAIELSETSRIAEELDNISNKIKQFISVRSFVTAYAEALAPYQQAANAILGKLENIAGSSIPDEIIEASKTHQMFLTAINVKDFGSEQAIELLDGIDKVYSSRVQVGLAQSKYYIPELTDRAANDPGEAASPEPPCAPDHDSTTQPLLEDNAASNGSTTEDQKPDDTNMLKSKYRIKTTKASASAFKSDILRMPKVIRTILPLFTNLGALTVDQTTRFGICMDCFDADIDINIIKNALAILATKGYVIAYEDDALKDTVYCLSHIGYTCMQKDTIATKMRSFWDISYGGYKFVGGEQIVEPAVFAAITNNNLLLAYFEGIKNQVSNDIYSIIKSSVRWVSDHYQAVVIWDSQQCLCKLLKESPDMHIVDNEGILIVAGELPTALDAESQFVFAYVDGTLYRLDGNWTKAPMDDSPTKTEYGLTIDNTEEAQGDTQYVPEDLEASLSLNRMHEYVESSKTPSDNEFVSLTYELLNAPAKDEAEGNKYLTKAVLLSKAASFVSGNQNSLALYKQLAAATSLFPDETDYSGIALVSIFPDYSPQTEGMMLSAYMIALLSPNQKHDYMLYSQAKALHDDYEAVFPSYPYIKPLIHKLISIEAVVPEGFSDSIISLLGNAAEKAAFLKELQASAKALLSVPVIKAKMNGLPELCSSAFGPNSDLRMCMEIISDDNYSDKNYVAEILSGYSAENELRASLIEERIDKEWNEATKGKRTNKLQLNFLARDQVEDAFKKRLTLMKSWVEHVDNREDKRLHKLKNLKTELLQMIDDAQTALNKSLAVGNDRVVLCALKFMHQKLSGEGKGPSPFAELLLTGYISLDDKWCPVLDRSMTDVKYYEPWRNVLRHIADPELSYDEIKASIFHSSSRLFDNLHQLEMIGRLPDEDASAFIPTESEMREAVDFAENYAKNFTDKLEMAYTYNQIGEADKETLITILTQYRERIMGTKDFACWRLFVNALEKQVDEISQSRKMQLRTTLNLKKASLAAGTTVPLLEEAEELLERDSNYAVAEEYINRFDNGEAELSEELQAILHDSDSYNDFISDNVFKPVYDVCMRGTGRTLKSFGNDYLEKNLPKDWTIRLRENSKKMLDAWPMRRDNTSTASQVNNLFKHIGLNTKRAEKIQHPRVELYHLHVSRLARNQADYIHPVSAFGTQLKSPLSVVVLFGSYTAKQLVDTVTALNLGGIALVLLDRAYDLSTRRQMAEIFRTETSRQNPFLLIDQVLLLYLAMHQETERLPVMLKCTLPYTTYQPFVRDGGSTSDEMFCGRTRELSEIMNPGGACFVYGGRQLGKTALLERAESRCSRPESKEYAVYSNIIGCHDENTFVGKILSDINKKTNLLLAPAATIQELCQQLDAMFRSGKIVTMLLLLDEADNFLVALGKVKYAPLQPLIDLKRESKNYFKFVFAGLHNVCRAQNATANNGVFGQLGTPLCIKPLSPTDAFLLISRPLRYLGFRIDQYPHLETILTNTNYYPGILQFFGYTLVQTFNNNYAKYYRAADDHPPFTLRDEQLGSVMNSADLNQSIRDKFRWSLELDPRYFMLARCVTMLYHLSDGNVSQESLGFSVDKIQEMAIDYTIHCLENETRRDYISLLDEMMEMGILSKPKDEIYRLRRHSFINIIGSDMDKLEEEIMRINEEAV